MSWWWFPAFAAGFVLADRLLLWAERRGWIFYRRRKPTGGAGAAALGPIFDALQPSRTIVVQERRSQATRRKDQGNEDDVDRAAAGSMTRKHGPGPVGMPEPGPAAWEPGRMAAMNLEDITPDTKDWTWVLEHPCPECGFAAADLDAAEVADRLRDNAERWRVVLRGNGLRTRPNPGVWSPLEYGCHVRDVHRTMLGRVRLMLDEDTLTFANWDQDAAAVAGRYAEQDPAQVADELVSSAASAAATYDHVSGQDWDRPGLRSDGSRFTVASLARYHLHDVVHHLSDVGERA